MLTKMMFELTIQIAFDSTLHVTLKNAASPRPLARTVGASLTFFPRAAFLACVSWKRASLAKRFYILWIIQSYIRM